MHDLLGAHARLERLYRYYIRSAFPLRSLELAHERDALLERSGVLCQPPLVETTPVYAPSPYNLVEAARALPLPYHDLSALARGLFDEPATPLYEHQWRALQETIINDRDLVVTTGTGSGKTECFLLPLLAQLARESQSWPAIGGALADRFWWRHKGERVAQWAHSRRPHAVRALILYPLNALVEDQLRRLRATLDTDEVHDWMNRNRGGNRITFGRYTGATPVAGEPTNPKIERLREELKASDAAAAGLNGALSSHFMRMDGGEMWSRWDMQQAPPDVFITNYSMLNIALMRALEAPIWEATRAWLHGGDARERQFTLVLDELHSYRGTPGTEVAYLLRLLLLRLGLTPDSPQLRILTTTASLEDDPSGRRFVREFFGRDANSARQFAFLATPQDPPAPDAVENLRAHCTAFADFARASAPVPLDGAPNLNSAAITDATRDLADAVSVAASELAPVLEQIGARDALRGACSALAPDATVRPALAPALARALWPDEPQRDEALRGLLLALGMARGADGRSPQPTRGHFFFHNLGGLWACLNPGCSHLSAQQIAARQQKEVRLRPTVGALHASHRLSCECGSRVLDLIACEVCGDTFIGGFKSEKKNGVVTLTTDQPDLDKMPDRLEMGQRHGQYAVFWPQPNDSSTEPCDLRWSFTPFEGSGPFDAGWNRAWLHHPTGSLRVGASSPDASDDGWIFGWLYGVASGEKVGAMPGKCPRCDADYRRRQTFKSPLRAHRTGFQKACQVLAAGLMREMEGEKRKLVIFSDSRQDAAKLAAGMERDHFRDMLRLALLQTFTDFWPDLEAFVRTRLPFSGPDALVRLQALSPALAARATAATPPDAERANRFAALLSGRSAPLAVESLGWLANFPAQNAEARALWEELLCSYGGPVPLDLLHGPLFRLLLENGICPGGASFSALNFWPTRFESLPWFALWNWQTGAPQSKAMLSADESRHLSRLDGELYSEIMYALFRDLTRSLEALGEGQVVPTRAGTAALAPLVRSIVRQMGARRQFVGAQWHQPGAGTGFARRTRKFVERLAGGDPRAARDLEDELRDEILAVGAAVPAHNNMALEPAQLALSAPPVAQNDGSIAGFRCSECNGFYLEDVGLCPECERPVALHPSFTNDYFDYYKILASGTHGGVFRMNCEELTGQSDARTRPLRQRHFQDVFVADEIAAVQGIDLLSVTTTMEAGVDIGGLNAVMMANMPPRRFNYQQRVGRAGRRASGVSLAVTFCRGRSHDDFYYYRPTRITGDRPPAPYVDMGTEPILRRVLNKEVLRRAFENVILPASSARGDSVHGEFGRAADWNAVAPAVADWLRDTNNDAQLSEIIVALCAATPWQGDANFAARLKRELRGDLPAQISQIADAPNRTQEMLSERLANAGLLPMFGFPTRVRLLHCRWPRGQNDWPPREGTVDRELDIAIGQFAPGSETVKDKAVHTAIGVVSFKPHPRGVTTEDGFSPPLPLPNPQRLAVCARCSAVEMIPASASNGVCGACGSDEVRALDAREPNGFFTDGAPRDFDGQFEWMPRATRPTLGLGAAADADWRTVDGAQVLSFDQTQTVYSVNDDGGEGGFNFKAARRFSNAVDGAWLVDFKTRGDFSGTGEAHRVALLSQRQTDVLATRVEAWPTGVFADPGHYVGRAAWYSLAFFLRGAAGALLDVDALELEAGLWVSSRDGAPEGRAFLCDKLENGAGYCRFLGRQVNWRELLSEADATRVGSVAARWLGLEVELPGQIAHDVECDTSCSRCLRDFGNLPYHGLLDWRLALDMARLLRETTPSIDLRSDWAFGVANPWRGLIEGANAPIAQTMTRLGYGDAQNFESLTGWMPRNRKAKHLAILRHPLWSDEHPDWQAAVEAARAAYPDRTATAINPFVALRRPSECC